MRPRSERTADFLRFAILRTVEGATPEQIADEYMERMGWNDPAAETRGEA